MFSLCALVILACQAVQSGLGVPATYDQRQTGDLNVQVHIKDLNVVALVDSDMLEDYTDYDYFYDYADFTVKPITKPTTPSSTVISSTNSPSSETTNKDSTAKPLLSSQNSTTSSPILNSSSTENIMAEVSASPVLNATNEVGAAETNLSSTVKSVKSRINNKIGNLFGEDDISATTKDTETVMELSMVESSTLAEPVQGQRARKRCRSGYSPDGKGRCRRLNRRRLSLIPFAVKLAPQILDDRKHSTKDIIV